MSADPIVRTSMLELNDAEEIHGFLVDAYGSRMRGGGGERQLFRYRRVDAGLFQLDTAEHHTHLDTSSDPLRAIVVTRPTSARLERTSDGDVERYGPGDLFLAADPDLSFTHRWEPGEITNSILDPVLLDRVAATAPGPRPEPIRFTGLDPLSSAVAAQWWATRNYVAGLLDNPEIDLNALLLSTAANLLAAATLATFPNTALTDPTIEDRHDASAVTLRRAMAFVDDHAHEALTVSDIAAAAYVSIRAVQLAFRRHLDTTPMGYLRRVRLDGAHHELVAADPATTTVSQVAFGWGFGSHSRFTADYRRTYGVLPHVTLGK